MNNADRIKALPEADRPCEKMRKNGPQFLTDAELLAVIMRSGTRKKNVLTLAGELLENFGGSLAKLCGAGMRELKTFDGVGETKALQLIAAGEIAARIASENAVEKQSGGDSDSVGLMLMAEMGRRTVETFRVILLDKKLKIAGMKDVSTGTLDRTLVHPRDVFGYAVKEQAYAVILAHNHPSGEVEPSKEDVGLTKKLIEAGEALGIPVLDHFVVGRDKYYSMSAEGLLARLKAGAA